MLRRSRYVPALAVAACVLLAAACRDGGAHWTPVLAAPGPVFATAAAAGQMWAAEPAGSVISTATGRGSPPPATACCSP
jgi:hypothetical protein